ncbi:hypothetical protein NC652_040640 [Populus alba x Populus x berolinensis]|nr:hypothetical protein NC652_040640 [Populus alba x Populus x berolinensis]
MVEGKSGDGVFSWKWLFVRAIAEQENNKQNHALQWHTSQRASIPITVEPPPSLACFVEPIDRC